MDTNWYLSENGYWNFKTIIPFSSTEWYRNQKYFVFIVQQAVVNRTVKFYQGFEKVALQYETSFIATCVSCLLAQPVKSINQTIKLNRDNFLSSFHIKILVLHVFCQVCMYCSSILKVIRQLVFLHCFDT